MRHLQRVWSVWTLVTGIVVGASTLCSAQQTAPPLGAGLAGVTDWGRSHEFADVFRTSRAWGSPTDPWEGQETIALDANGWPTQDAGVVVMCCQPAGQNLGGVYRISLQCNTNPEIRALVNSGIVRNQTWDALTGIVTAELVVPQDPVNIMLGFFGTQGGVRNVKIMRPGTTDDQQFMPAFLEHNQRFNVLRFMDWTRTNNNMTQHWWQRNTPNSGSYRTGSGVPYEVCIDLCNTLGKDLWLNVPHLATDDFVREFARLIRDRLNPELHAYIEYSNETWNYLFQQADWLHETAVAEASSTVSDLAFDDSMDENNLRWRLHARRTVEISRIFAEEFPDGAMNNRVRVVLAGQYARDHQFDVMLKYISATQGPPANFIYSLAGAPYIYMGNIDDTRTDLTPLEVLGALQADFNRFVTSPAMERLASYSSWHNLAPMAAYEGGPDTAGPNNVEAKRLAFYDPWMQQMCEDYLRYWFENGGGQFQWFVSGATSWLTPYGAYSLTEVMSNQQTPKILAVDALVNNVQPTLTIGFNVPGVFDTRQHVRRDPDWASRPMPQLGPSSSVDYLVRAGTTDEYQLFIEAAGYREQSLVDVFVDGALQGQVTIQRTGSSAEDNYSWFGPLTMRLTAGLNTVRFQPVNSDYNFRMRTVRVDSTCDSIDFNADLSIYDPMDIQAFLSVYSEGPCIPVSNDCGDLDFNNDGSIFDPRDIEAFLRVYSEGPC